MYRVFKTCLNVDRLRLALLCSLLILVPQVVCAVGSSPATEVFFQNPAVSEVRLSPDGEFLGMLVTLKSGRVQLATVEIATGQSKVVAGLIDTDIRRFHWVNSKRLVFDTLDRESARGESKMAPGLFAVNRDGSEASVLIRRSPESRDVWALPWNHVFHSVKHGKSEPESDDIFVNGVRFNDARELEYLTLIKLNSMTGKFELFPRPGRTRGWLIDNNGQPRIAIAYDKGKSSIHYKDPTTGDWRVIVEFEPMDPEAFSPLDFGPDGTLYVTASLGRDKSAIYSYDFVNNRINREPVFSLKNYDVSGGIVSSATSILGVHYTAASPNTYWFDTKLQSIQKTVDGLLPGLVNRLGPTESGDLKRLVVISASDTSPAQFYLFDSETQKLTLVGRSQPGIAADQMASTEMVRYVARDGLEIPAYLTLPKDSTGRKLPMLVLVHGGPFIRGSDWLWNGQVQFLASRGYAVLEPAFRGSTGFGEKHFRAGFKQWGLAMQDDIADGAKWAIAQGYADAERICIAGSSYGGYATLMGLVNDPKLFRCGVSWAGVTDIDLMYKWDWSDLPEEYKNYGMPKLIGDPEKDAAQLKATSPILQAARITRPLLLAYGKADRRVPMIHGTKFYEAVKVSNPDVQWVEYAEEGHGWWLVKTRVDFWNRVERFLDQHIGQRVPKAIGAQ